MIENKVSAQTIAGLLSGGITWFLVTYIFHGSIPSTLAPIIPVAAGSVTGFAAGWLAKHQPRDYEVTQQVYAVITGLLAQQQAQQRAQLAAGLDEAVKQPSTFRVPSGSRVIIGEGNAAQPAGDPQALL